MPALLLTTLIAAPPVLQRTIATKGDEQWLGIPGIERGAGGRLWVTAYTGGAKEPDPANRVLLWTSGDDGASWQRHPYTVDPPGDTRAFDPTLWLAPDGALWLIVNLANLAEKQHQVAVAINPAPDEPGSTFCAPRPLELGVPYAFRMNKPTQTSWGELLLPVTWARAAPDGWFAGPAQLQGAAIRAADDTWSLHGAVEAPHWALENMIVERRDGSLWMLIRTGDRRLWESVSTDRGRTWSEGRPTAIVNPGSRFFIRRLHSGRLLLLNSPRPDSRTGLVAQLSDDDGASWGEPLMLDPRPGVSYPDAVEAADGRIFAVHDRDRGGDGEIVLSVFAEQHLPGG